MSKEGSSSRLIVAGIVVTALLVTAGVFRMELNEALQSLQGWMKDAGALGIVVFVLVYVLATVMLFPAWILTVGAGLTYGLATGTVLVSVSSVLGATSSFLISRSFLRETVARRIGADPRFASIDEAIAKQGWKIVLLIRLSPAFPFNLLNYALGLTRIPVHHYAASSWLGMLPGTLMYVYLGSLGTFFIDGRERTAAEYAMMIGGFAATVAVTVYVTRIARNALRRSDATRPALALDKA